MSITKNLFASAIVFLTASVGFTAEVKNAQLSADKSAIEIDVVYAGGCVDHQFELVLGGCLESMPPQCGAELIDRTQNDMCEGLIGKKVVIPLAKVGLPKEFFDDGTSLSISGSNKSSATIRLPRE
jgi:hypothetical protein